MTFTQTNLLVLLRKVVHRISVRIYSFYIKLLVPQCGDGLHIEFPSIIYAPECISIGNNVCIRGHSWFNCAPNGKRKNVLKIGDGSYLGRFLQISAKEEVDIGKHVMIMDRVYIGDYSHEFSDRDVPILQQPLTEGQKVTIKDGAWIGIGAVIFPGVTIGKNAVVGANAVVTKNVPDHYVARGVPAKMFPNKNPSRLISIKGH